MRWKIVSRVAKRTHEQFRVEVYLRVGFKHAAATLFTPRPVRTGQPRRAKRERERKKERERKSTSDYPHRSLKKERKRNRRRRRRVRTRRVLVKRIIDRESVPFKDGSKSQIDVALIDARFPANLLAKRRHHHRTTKAKFVVVIVVVVIIIDDDYVSSKRTGTSWIGFSGVTRAPNGRMHFCADWRSSGQQLNENRTPSAFSRSDHDIADAMMCIHYSGLLFLEEGEESRVLARGSV